MRRVGRIVGVLLPVLAGVLGAAPCRLRAEEQAPEDWRAQATKVGLGGAAIDALARDRFVVGSSVAQVFSPYVERKRPLPAFVTADSVLHVFHALLEEAVTRQESARAAELGALLARIAAVVPEG